MRWHAVARGFWSVGGAKRLYGIVEGGDLAYVEERVDADGDWCRTCRPAVGLSAVRRIGFAVAAATPRRAGPRRLLVRRESSRRPLLRLPPSTASRTACPSTACRRRRPGRKRHRGRPADLAANHAGMFDAGARARLVTQLTHSRQQSAAHQPAYGHRCKKHMITDPRSRARGVRLIGSVASCSSAESMAKEEGAVRSHVDHDVHDIHVRFRGCGSARRVHPVPRGAGRRATRRVRPAPARAATRCAAARRSA